MEQATVVESSKEVGGVSPMKSWGLSASFDLYGCDPFKVRDKDTIEQFFIQLTDLIDMVRFGPVHMYHFGTDNKEGYSAFQLIQTSCISGHFAEESNTAYLDVFSCKWYNPEVVREFAVDYFGAKSAVVHVAERR